MEKFENALALFENIPKNERNKIVALDCEMTGSSHYGTADRHRSLLRATVLDGHGNVLLDEFCSTSKHEIRTSVHGISKNDIKDKQHPSDLKEKVKELIESKIIVGHDLSHDFGVLGFRPDWKLCKDTSERFLWTAGKQFPALKDLAEMELNVKIQVDTHDSREDALAALLIYAKNFQSWDDPGRYADELIRKDQILLERKLSAKYQCKICDVSSHSEKSHNLHLAGKKHRHKALLAELEEQEWETCSESDECSEFELPYDLDDQYPMKFEDIWS